MRRSEDRIITTHTGSLPKPQSLVEELERRDAGDVESPSNPALDGMIRDAVDDVVRRQVDAGIDVVNDGEAGKVSYATYVRERLIGFGGPGTLLRSPEHAEFGPLFVKLGVDKGLGVALPGCDGEIVYRGQDAVARDVKVLQAALDGSGRDEAFLSAASPGCIAVHLANEHYASDEAYVFALADAMKAEYDAIHRAGIVLQLDCPDIAMGRHLPFSDLTLPQFRRRAGMHIEALNYAVRDIPADALRMHVCWGNYEGPHIYDVPFADIVDLVFKAKPAAICFEAANPRHAHEWKMFEEIAVPGDKVLVPGVIDSTTNFVEHPELVAERITRLARLVGRERVMAGSDCGFATFTRFQWIEPQIVWLKLRALVEGAALASDALW